MKITAGLRSMAACVPYQVTPTSTYYPATIQPVIPKCTQVSQDGFKSASFQVRLIESATTQQTVDQQVLWVVYTTI